MPRAKRAFHIKSTKENFSCPRYIAIAAKLAAGHPEKDFSPWVVAAIEAKMQRENPGLIESTKADLLKRLETYPELPEDANLRAAEEPARGPWPTGQSPREIALREEMGPAKVTASVSAALKKAQKVADRSAKPGQASRGGRK